MKYLVTGGSGFIGRNLVLELLKDGHTVRAYDNNFRGYQETFDPLHHPKLEIIQGDIRDEGAVAAACQGMDCVLHLAYINGTEFFYDIPELILDVGVRGMLAVLAGCRKAGVRDLLTMSSSEVYQTPPRIPTDETVPLTVPDVLNPRYSYGGGKIISELLTVNYGRTGFDRVTIVRPHNVFGPNMGKEHVIPQLTLRMIADIARAQAGSSSAADRPMDFSIQGDGSQTRAFIYIDDFIAGVKNILSKGQHLQVYHVGTSEELTIRSVAEQVAAVLGVSIVVKPGEEPAGATKRRCPDISKIKAIGFSPSVPFQEGIRRTVLWYREHYQSLMARS